MALSRAGFLVAVALSVAQAASAAEPVLRYLFPLAGQRGTTVALAATGTFETWPPQVWVDAPGLVFHGEKDKGKLTVEIAPDAPLGPHLVRIFTAQGASAPRFFFVSGEREILEAEPNDDFKAPQKIDALPINVSGRLEKSGDVDSFAVTLKQGQPFTAFVEAYTLGSPFDGLLRLVDEKGTQVAFNHDGSTLDPLLRWTAPRDGVFVVQLMGFANPPGSGVNFAGSDSCLYRLHLSTDAPLPPTLPPSDSPDQLEQEPNDTIAQAAALPLPAAVAGAIQKPGDEDRFSFTAVKGTAYELKLQGPGGGSPLLPWLRVESRDGRELARTDGAGKLRDPQLIWKAPSDGPFVAAVGDVTHHGSEHHVYRLSVREAAPSVTAAATSHSLLVSSAKTGEIKVAVKRVNGFKAALQLVAKDLPAGLTAPEVDVPEKDGEVILRITAAEDSAPASQPLRVVLREKEAGTEYSARYFLPASEKGDGATGPSELVIDSTDVLWLTVLGKAASSKE